ncbi:hypothetical protein COLO4_15419 [Corchorus olitorius]|uniref:Uncharacterized protein n=1 Tax=Corchorus olitorius TaxID=93759 RepID=A0A1R3JN34_9ROSI|nr:hypothetical protein COLO4_15419 [Corchorus olitorius]
MPTSTSRAPRGSCSSSNPSISQSLNRLRCINGQYCHISKSVPIIYTVPSPIKPIGRYNELAKKQPHCGL